MLDSARFFLGWVVLIGLIATFIVSIVGLYSIPQRSKKERYICGFIGIISVLGVILLSNII